MGVDSWTRSPYERAWQNGKRPTSRQRDMPHGQRESTADKARGWLAGERKCHCGCGQFGTRFRGGKLMCRDAARINDSKANGQAQGPQDRTPPNPRRWI